MAIYLTYVVPLVSDGINGQTHLGDHDRVQECEISTELGLFTICGGLYISSM